MTRTNYLAAVIACFLSAPDTPEKASRSDWAVASTLFQQNIPLDNVQHAIHLASVRRSMSNQASGVLGPINSLAYFRQAVHRLTRDELDPTYVAYVSSKFQQLIAQQGCETTESVDSSPECRGF